MGSTHRQNTEKIKFLSPFGSHFWVNFGDHLGVLFSALFERASERLSGCLEGDWSRSASNLVPFCVSLGCLWEHM